MHPGVHDEIPNLPPRPATEALPRAVPATRPAETESAARPAEVEPAEVEPAEVEPAEVGPAAPVRARRIWTGLLLAAGLYTLLRAVCLAVLSGYAADERGWGLLYVLGQRFDALWYSSIVTGGYDTVVGVSVTGGPGTTNLAFFPLYPALIKAFGAVLPGGVTVAALAVAWTAGLAAAAGLYLLGTHLRSRTAGVILAAVWAVIPNASVESMAYSETLFTALAVFSLYFVLRGRWLPAAGLCVLAGVTRPTAAALIAAVGLAALVEVVRRPARWTAWLAMPIAPLGQVGYMWWVGHRLGHWNAYFQVQNDAWKMGFDLGQYTVDRAGQLMDVPQPLVIAVTTAVVALAVLLLVVAAGERIPWPLLVYAGVLVLIVFLGDGYFWAKARMLIPAFPLLLPVAYGLARSRNRLVAPAVLAGLTAFSATYGVYVSLVWTQSP